MPLAAAHGRVLGGGRRRPSHASRLSTFRPWTVTRRGLPTWRRCPSPLRRIGSVPAGARFEGAVRARRDGSASSPARPVPEGADTIVHSGERERRWRRDHRARGRTRRPLHPPRRPRFSRGRGGASRREGALDARAIGLAAAMNQPWLTVRRKPRIALLATGDEIVMPGEPLGGSQIVSSNTHALRAVVEGCGGRGDRLGHRPR